jgi:hypothetical protein
MRRTAERCVWNLKAAICAAALATLVPSIAMTQTAGSPDDLVSSDGAAKTPVAAEGVQGRVTFASGKPAANVFVQARSLGSPTVALPDIGIFTNKSGEFFWPLPPGRFELTFSQDGRKLATRKIDVGKSRPARLDVELPARN